MTPDLLFPYSPPRGAVPVELGATRLSLVAPVFNELDNLRPLHARVVEVFGHVEAGGLQWELILVNDGSTDGSEELIRQLHAEDPRVRGVYFGANRGQTAAIAAGIHAAAGELIATLDADMQNDPIDLPDMIRLLDELGPTGAPHDAVVGWRMKRNDTWVRRVSSRLANAVRNSISQDSIRDTGCSLKVFRREAIQAIPLFEGMHRFLPTLLRYHDFDVVEHGVSHHPRTAGVSKYGVSNRAWRAFKDLVAVRWMHRRLLRLPITSVDAPQAHSESRPRGGDSA